MEHSHLLFMINCLLQILLNTLHHYIIIHNREMAQSTWQGLGPVVFKKHFGAMGMGARGARGAQGAHVLPLFTISIYKVPFLVT